jgi:hypothetical protein
VNLLQATASFIPFLTAKDGTIIKGASLINKELIFHLSSSYHRNSENLAGEILEVLTVFSPFYIWKGRRKGQGYL